MRRHSLAIRPRPAPGRRARVMSRFLAACHPATSACGKSIASGCFASPPLDLSEPHQPLDAAQVRFERPIIFDQRRIAEHLSSAAFALARVPAAGGLSAENGPPHLPQRSRRRSSAPPARVHLVGKSSTTWCCKTIENEPLSTAARRTMPYHRNRRSASKTVPILPDVAALRVVRWHPDSGRLTHTWAVAADLTRSG